MPRRYTGPDNATMNAVLRRCLGACEVCGDALYGSRGVEWSLHHRRGRDGRRDSHSVQNLLAVHGASNVDRCHGRIHSRRSEAQPAGWWLSRAANEDPLTVPVLIGRGSRWCYLSDQGTYEDAPLGEAA